jgi:hypothetical protein
VRQRYPQLSGLELHCINLGESFAELAPLELIHAARVFVHAGTSRCLDNALALVDAAACRWCCHCLAGGARRRSEHFFVDAELEV